MIAHTLALSIDNTPVLLPSDVDTLTKSADTFANNLTPFIINLFFFVGIFLAFGYFLFGGIRWIISQGEKKEIDKARDTMTAAFIGLAIIFFAYLLINIIGAFLHIPLLGK